MNNIEYCLQEIEKEQDKEMHDYLISEFKNYLRNIVLLMSNSEEKSVTKARLSLGVSPL